MIERLAGGTAVGRRDEMAGILAAAFDRPDQRWSAESVAATLLLPGTVAFLSPEGCALMRLAADEAEILTVAVLATARRKGLAAALMAACLAEAAAKGAVSMHLEVAEGNAAARALYRHVGFLEAGRRRGYYRGPGGREDALLMTRRLAAAAPPRAPA